jgi:hypothetical protein
MSEQELKPYQQRAVNEKEELDEKIVKLSGFIIDSPFFAAIDLEEQRLLKEQIDVMWKYSEILTERIALFK